MIEPWQTELLPGISRTVVGATAFLRHPCGRPGVPKTTQRSFLVKVHVNELSFHCPVGRCRSRVSMQVSGTGGDLQNI